MPLFSNQACGKKINKKRLIFYNIHQNNHVMRRNMLWLVGGSIVLSNSILSSCSQDDDVVVASNDVIKQITVSIPQFDVEDETATRVSVDVNSLSVTWINGDTLGIFPSNGYPTAFPITDGVGSSQAIFDGGSWGLRSNDTYAAYFPFSWKKANKNAIPVVFTGQHQKGNNNADHFSQIDYMATSATKVTDDGKVNFEMKHLAAYAMFVITVPEADTFSKLSIISEQNDLITTSTFSVNDANPALKAQTKSRELSMTLSGIKTNASNQTITIFMMMAPNDYSANNYTMKLKGAKNVYTGTFKGSNFTPSSAKLKRVTLIASTEDMAPANALGIDLGLTTTDGKKLLWANMNVGAESPEEYGDYFAAAEIAPKETYTWNNYIWCEGTNSTLTKYCTNKSFGIVDNAENISTEDDAAAANWGGKWRIPTNSEIQNLMTSCQWERVSSYNGKNVNGYLVTGSNGNSMFLPLAGYKENDQTIEDGSIAYYTTTQASNKITSYKCYSTFIMSSKKEATTLDRSIGKSVRAVMTVE